MVVAGIDYARSICSVASGSSWGQITERNVGTVRANALVLQDCIKPLG